VLAGAETFVDIALFGEKKRGFLRRFRPFRKPGQAAFHKPAGTAEQGGQTPG